MGTMSAPGRCLHTHRERTQGSQESGMSRRSPHSWLFPQCSHRATRRKKPLRAQKSPEGHSMCELAHELGSQPRSVPNRHRCSTAPHIHSREESRAELFHSPVPVRARVCLMRIYKRKQKTKVERWRQEPGVVAHACYLGG